MVLCVILMDVMGFDIFDGLISEPDNCKFFLFLGFG